MDIWHILVCHGFLPRQHYRTAYFPIQGLVFAATTHSQHFHLCLHNNYLSSPCSYAWRKLATGEKVSVVHFSSTALQRGQYLEENIRKYFLKIVCTCVNISIWASIVHLANVFFPLMYEIRVYCFYPFPGGMNRSDCSSFWCSSAVCKISTKTIFPAWGHQLRREANYHKWPVKMPCTLHAEKLNRLLSVFSVAQIHARQGWSAFKIRKNKTVNNIAIKVVNKIVLFFVNIDSMLLTLSHSVFFMWFISKV